MVGHHMRMRFHRAKKRAQGLVEFAVAMPIVVLMLLVVVDIAALIYQEASFAYGLSQINWNIEYKEALAYHTQAEKNKLLKDAICIQLEVNPSEVTVTNAAFTKISNESMVDLGYTDNDPVNGVWSANEVRLNLRFTGKIDCISDLPVPILMFHDVKYSFDLNRVVPYESQFEVSWYAPRGL